MTREEWLENAIAQWFKPHFEKHAPDLSFPEKVRVSIGFPSKKATAKRGKALGQCWQREHTNDGAPHIFISPFVETVSDSEGILSILAHELIHSCGIKGHGKDFKKAGIAIGLKGNMHKSVADNWLIELFKNELSLRIGPYPHGGVHVDLTGAPVGTKPDKCRMVKCTCGMCGYTVRTTQKWIDVAVPMCPVCNIDMDK